MFTHVVLGSNDIAKSKAFYDAFLATLDQPKSRINANGKSFSFLSEKGVLTITLPINGEPATFANGSTIGFKAETEDQVDAAYQAAIATGGVSISAPEKVATPFGFYIAKLTYFDIKVYGIFSSLIACS